MKTAETLKEIKKRYPQGGKTSFRIAFSKEEDQLRRRYIKTSL